MFHPGTCKARDKRTQTLAVEIYEKHGTWRFVYAYRSSKAIQWPLTNTMKGIFKFNMSAINKPLAGCHMGHVSEAQHCRGKTHP